nr:MAG TPA: hypothetical protein [Caudoviricetes sp.]
MLTCQCLYRYLSQQDVSTYVDINTCRLLMRRVVYYAGLAEPNC